MKWKLRTQLTLGFICIVLLTVAFIFMRTNRCIGRQYEAHLQQQQEEYADTIALGLSQQYSPLTSSWNVEFIHGYGMAALSQGYIVKVYDLNGQTVWDAQNHDMTQCRKLMEAMAERMQKVHSQEEGGYMEAHYNLMSDGVKVGTASVGYYGPYSMSEGDFRFLDALNKMLVSMALIAVLAAGTAGYLLARHITNPIIRVTETTREIAAGNYETRVQGKASSRELAELTAAVNDLAGTLGDQEMLRRRLVTDVAHEMRTPIANVSTHLELMAEGIWEPTRERLNACCQELSRIAGLLGDLSRLQQMESEQLVLHREPVEFKALLEDIQELFAGALQEKHIDCRLEGGPLTAEADRDRISQVLQNLMSNAVKYTPEGGSIRWTLAREEDSARISITDSGIGIDKKDLPYLFERFYRADPSRHRKTGGTGVGLTIAQAIVRAHGGRITVESTPGKGSTFTVTIPLAVPGAKNIRN